MNNLPLFILRILCIFLPFHAFLITLSSKYIFGSEKDSLSLFSFGVNMWKEILFVILLFCGIKNIRKLEWKRLDTYLLTFIALHIVIALYQYFSSDTSFVQILWGMRTNLEFIGIFWILRLFSFSKKNIQSLVKTLLIATTISLSLGVIQLIVPCEKLTTLGYTGYISSWVADKPLPCGHGIGEDLNVIRVMGTFSGPNQLASFLLLSLALLYYSFKEKLFSRSLSLGLSAVHFIFLLLTFSRGALLGFVLAGIYLVYRNNREKLKKYLLPIFTIGILLVIVFSIFAPSRIASTKEHIEKPLIGIQRVLDHPLGLGVGKAGPVSLRFPPDGSAGLISENWYIQIAEEVGIIGFILLLFILYRILLFLSRTPGYLNIALLSAFVALSINSLFLHTWANDMITTITFWIFFSLSYKLHFQNK